MTNATVEALIVDFLSWLNARERTYQEALEAWRTSCPRLPVWEDAKDRGFVAQEVRDGREFVRNTPVGSAFLQQQSNSLKIVS